MNRKLPTKTVDADGTVLWKLNGLYHREDGPAIQYASGTKAWYISGKHIKTVYGVK